MGPAAGALIRTVAWGPALAGIPHTGQEDPMNACAAGIDVGKSFFDVGMAPSGHNFRVPNAPKGVAVVIGRLRRSRVRRVVLEAIGPYGAALIAALRTNGFEVGVVNPRRIKAFRDAEGHRAKTDRLDAGLIARFALTMTDIIRPLPSAEQLTLKALATRRRQCLEGELLGARQGPDDIGHGQSKPRDEAGVQPVRLGAVSYTHLRAHETGRNLVCRLLLEKKKKTTR